MPGKPRVKLVGENGNVFNLLGLCTRALKRAGQEEEANKLTKAVFGCGSYDEALQKMLEYCDVEAEEE